MNEMITKVEMSLCLNKFSQSLKYEMYGDQWGECTCWYQGLKGQVSWNETECFFYTRFIELFKKYHGLDEHKLKLKRPTQLQEVLNIARDLLANIKEGIPIFERRNKLHQLKSVLEM